MTIHFKNYSKIHFYATLFVGTIISGFQMPLQASEMDDRIESTFHKSYVYQTYLHEDAIVVQSKDGVVTLKGDVAKDSHKDLAQETVAELPGVKKVDNRLKVKGTRPATHSDLWIHAKVETALLFHRNVSATKTEISVTHGAVQLKGEAKNEAQKELVGEYVADVSGVKSVKNDMTVATASPTLVEQTILKIDDASITALVKVSLLSHRSTSAMKTHVNTKDGIVTLTGKAMNAAERDLVTKLTEDIEGVQSVVNQMTIQIVAVKN